MESSPKAWLVPDNAPIASRKVAMKYLAKEKSIQEIIDFYQLHRVRVNVNHSLTNNFPFYYDRF